MTSFSVWTAFEINLAIICASAPALKPLINHYAPRILGSSFITAAQSRLPGSRSKFASLNGPADEIGSKGAGTYVMTKISGSRSFKTHIEGHSGRFDGRGDAKKGFYDSGSGDSDELIFGRGGITRTTEIDVRSMDLKQSQADLER
jgi:hypothetical protein